MRIEEHARYLQKILEEQQKAGTALISPSGLDSGLQPLSPSASASPSQPAEIDSSSLLTKHKAYESESEEQVCQKRVRLEAKLELSPNESVTEDSEQ